MGPRFPKIGHRAHFRLVGDRNLNHKLLLKFVNQLWILLELNVFDTLEHPLLLQVQSRKLLWLEGVLDGRRSSSDER